VGCTSKIRTATKDEISGLAVKFNEFYNSDDDSIVEVDLKDASNKLNASIGIVKEVFIEAINQGLRNVKLTTTNHFVPKYDKSSIKSKGNFVISKDVIDQMNKSLAADRQFKIGDKFDVALDGENIVVTRIPNESSQEEVASETTD